jgi:uncharacterized protein (TIGR01777 family)
MEDVAMKVLVSGASGFVGEALLSALRDADHGVLRLVRRERGDGACVPWDPARGQLDPALLTGIEAAVNLSGENIATGRWTSEKKRRILESRVASTRVLSETLARLDPLPRVLVSASAIGFYGDRGGELLDEDSAPGTGFLAEVCQQWEAATEPARAAGIRVVLLRIGAVLDPAGGALAKMVFPFKMGLGGVVGDGGQYMSWITRADLVGAILHALNTEALHGPVNAMSPQPVTNREFTRALASALHRPALLPMPAFGVKLAFGEMGENLMLASTRAVPRRLEESGFVFQHPEICAALRALLAG